MLSDSPRYENRRDKSDISNNHELSKEKTPEQKFQEIEIAIARLRSIVDSSQEFTANDQENFYKLAKNIENTLVDVLFGVDKERARRLHTELVSIGDDFDSKFSGDIISNDMISSSRDEKTKDFMDALPDSFSDTLKDKIMDDAVLTLI